MAQSINQEDVRKTLEFFKNYLLKKGPKLLHQLASLFGSKRFTDEMRRVVGRSEKNLRQFLLCYSTLFEIDENNIISYIGGNIRAISEPSSLNIELTVENKIQPNLESNHNDNNEIVVTLRQRLQDYPIGKWVPIVHLLSHRPVTIEEIMKTLIQIIKGHPDIFTIKKRSKSPKWLVRLNQNSSNVIRTMKDDLSKNTNLAVEYFAKKLLTFPEGKSVSVGKLFKYRIEAEKQVQQICSGNMQHFISFLKMHPNIFKVTKRRNKPKWRVLLISLSESANLTTCTNFIGECAKTPEPKTNSPEVNEAIEYFVDKLENKYKVKIDVQITSLFGHRAQANDIIRQVSGNNPDEFKIFLSNHPEFFTITGETVCLTKLSSKFSGPFTSGTNQMNLNFDQADIDEAVEYFRQKLLLNVHGYCASIVKLFGHRSQANSRIQRVCGKNPEEFAIFLSKHPSVFNFFTPTLVRLTNPPKTIPEPRRIPNISNNEAVDNNVFFNDFITMFF